MNHVRGGEMSSYINPLYVNLWSYLLIFLAHTQWRSSVRPDEWDVCGCHGNGWWAELSITIRALSSLSHTSFTRVLQESLRCCGCTCSRSASRRSSYRNPSWLISLLLACTRSGELPALSLRSGRQMPALWYVIQALFSREMK